MESEADFYSMKKKQSKKKILNRKKKKLSELDIIKIKYNEFC